MSWPAYRERYLAALTAAQLRELPRQREGIVIIPTGAVEQHGPHLPVAVDALLGQVWCERIGAACPADWPVWIAPPVAVGKSNEHTGYPGTLILKAETLAELVTVLLEQLYALGFRRLAILNTHGGNSAVLRDALRAFAATHPGAEARGLRSDVKLDISAQEATYGFHAGEVETALVRAAQEDWTRPDRAVCDWPARLEDPGELRPECAPAIFSWATADLSPSGVMGDARRGDPERGEQWIQAITAGYVHTIGTWLGK